MYNFRVVYLFFCALIFIVVQPTMTMAQPKPSSASASTSGEPQPPTQAESVPAADTAAATTAPASPTQRAQALQLSVSNPMILFNKALEFSKQQNFGLALAYLREVQLLEPRHKGTRQALDYIQHQLNGKGIRTQEDFFESAESSFLNTLLLPEILTIHWVLSLILLVVLSKLYREFKRARLQQQPSPAWQWPQWSIAFVWCLATLILIVKIISATDTKATIISSGPTPMRSGPVAEATELVEIPEGTLLSVNDFHDDWVQVSRQNLPMGWVQRDQILILSPDGFK